MAQAPLAPSFDSHQSRAEIESLKTFITRSYPADPKTGKIPLNQCYEAALHIALFAHRGVTNWDKSAPYIHHPIELAHRWAHGREDKFVQTDMAGAVMHDVVEDSGLLLQDIIDMDFPDDVITFLDAMTQRFATENQPKEPFFAYIHRLSKHDKARDFKLFCDMAHNLDNSRILKHVPAGNVHYERKLITSRAFMMLRRQGILQPEDPFHRLYHHRPDLFNAEEFTRHTSDEQKAAFGRDPLKSVIDPSGAFFDPNDQYKLLLPDNGS